MSRTKELNSLQLNCEYKTYMKVLKIHKFQTYMIIGKKYTRMGSRDRKSKLLAVMVNGKWNKKQTENHP